MMRKLITHLFGMALIALAGMAAAQAAEQKRTFEVASIKKNDSGNPNNLFLGTAGRFSAQNVTLSMLIDRAYNVQDFQVVGGPGWLNSEHYDVEAKADGNATGKEINGPMLQSLLEERFKLVSHRETRELSVYLLSTAKSGPKLKVGSCLTREANMPPAPGQRQSDFCGFGGIGNGTLRMTGTTMDAFTDLLSTVMKRKVVDSTGFKDKFDVSVRWAPDPVSAGNAGPAPSDTTGPSIFTVLQEELGLKLESGKGPVEILVVDHVERPTEN